MICTFDFDLLNYTIQNRFRGCSPRRECRHLARKTSSRCTLRATRARRTLTAENDPRTFFPADAAAPVPLVCHQRPPPVPKQRQYPLREGSPQYFWRFSPLRSARQRGESASRWCLAPSPPSWPAGGGDPHKNGTERDGTRTGRNGTEWDGTEERNGTQRIDTITKRKTH